jgi:hypothetical protein
MANATTGFIMPLDGNGNVVPLPRAGGTVINVATTTSAVIDATRVRAIRLTANSGNVYLTYGETPADPSTTAEILMDGQSIEYYLPANWKVRANGNVQIVVHPSV